MNYAIKGIYNNGIIKLIEEPDFHEPVEVIVIFPEKKKQIRKIRGLFKDFPVDYDKIETNPSN